MFVMLIAVLAILLPAPSAVARQQPETLSLLGEPLYPPKLSKAARAAADAELQRAHAAYTAKPSGVSEILAISRAQLALGRVGDSLVVLTRGLEANAESPELHLERGRGYILIRKFAAAQRDLTKAAKLPEARCALGLAQYLAADYARARTSYAECKDGGPSAPLRAGIFAYLADRRAGGTPAQRPVPDGPPIASSSPIRFPGTAANPKEAAPEPLSGAYLTAIEQLLDGKADAARQRLKSIVEKNRSAWMEPAYIAAEADYARLHKPRKKQSRETGNWRPATGDPATGRAERHSPLHSPDASGARANVRRGGAFP
jgi:tetratricopeptide (TPR) repeat protein